jgi:hypothetical protein
MSLLQTALRSVSTTSPCPPFAAQCSAVHPSCKDRGVSRQSGARMLHCCPYRESNTQIEEGGKNHGIRFTQPKIITRIYVYILFDCRENSSYMQCKQTQAYVRTSTHTLKTRHTHTHTHTYTHTHTSMHKAKNQTNTRGKHVLETQNTHTMTSFRKSGLQPNIASEGLMH